MLGPFSCVPSICSGHRETNYFHLFGNPQEKLTVLKRPITIVAGCIYASMSLDFQGDTNQVTVYLWHKCKT